MCMARQRDKTYFVQRFKPPRIVVSSNEFLVFVIHRNERQLRSLRRLLDGSEFSVKAVEYPEPALLAGPPTLAGRPFNVRAKKLTDGALVHMIGLPGYGVGSTYEYRLAMVDAKHAGQNGMYAGYERLEGRARRLFGASGGAVLDSNGQLTGVFLASGVDERSVTDFLPQDIIHSLRTYLSK